MNDRNVSSRFAARFAKAAGVLSIAAIAGLAAIGGAEAKDKHGFHGHKHRHHFAFDYGYYPYYDGHYFGRCFYRGWDGRIYKRRHCRDYGYWRGGHYWR